MRCPYCKSTNDRVVDSRRANSESVIRRRRECLECLKRFTTYERVEEVPLRVIKKDGRRATFERENIRSVIFRACEKRNVPDQVIEKIVTDLEDEISKKYDREVPTTFIGMRIMERLREIDQVAYVRFASVYREFKDAADFAREVEGISASAGAKN